MKKYLIYASIAAIVGLAGMTTANAQGMGFGNYPPIVERIAEQFNLDTEEVEEFLDEFREEKSQEMQVRFEEKLDRAVTNSVIDEDQKEAILAKKTEMREFCEELGDISPQERQDKMREMREEMRSWAEDEGIKWGFMQDAKVWHKGLHRHFGR